MTNEITEPLLRVLNAYLIKVNSIRNESYKDKKGVWWVSTPEGNKILKKMSVSEDTLKYILSAVRHLKKNGTDIPEVIQTATGGDFVKINDTCYILLEAIDGKNPSYDIPQQLAAIVKGLARFHRASSGFTPLPDTKPKVHLGTWINDYEQQLDDMNRFYKNELANKSNDEIGALVIKEFPAFYSRARNAIEGLKCKDYSNWVENAKKSGCLCHQDFAAGNLFLTPSGKLYVIDIDSITMDIPARDIRKLLNKIMKKNGKWDWGLTKKVLEYYQSENPLTESQWQVVKYDLMFPHLFIGAMNKYYYKREKDWTGQNYLKRLKEVLAIEKTIQPVLENFNLLIPR